MAERKTTNIIIAGVGGQGNRTLANIIAHAALGACEDVCVQSSTSLGRLGGPITCHIRIGLVMSATIPKGEADILVALEMNEALRALPMMCCGSLAFICTYRRIPVSADIDGIRCYPSVDEIEKAGMVGGITCIFVPQLLSLDRDVGQLQTTNSIMLGVLYGYTKLLSRALVEQALCQCLPDYKEQNLHALATGWQYGEKLQALK